MTIAPSYAGRPFLKMHGARNHFVIVDARERPFVPDASDIVRICDPTVGVGADELIVMEPGQDGSDTFMRIYNGDGREVEACGNATRCVAWLIMGESGSEVAVVKTLAGTLECRLAGDHRVTAYMGRVTSNWQTIPLTRDVDTLHLPVSSGVLSDAVGVNVGNPHAVFFVDDLDAVDVSALAPAIQSQDLFPNDVNVGVAQLRDSKHLKLVVYERGAGLTMACGSGACAAVYAARARNLVGQEPVDVELPGGTLTVDLVGDDAWLTGPVARSFSGVF